MLRPTSFDLGQRVARLVGVTGEARRAGLEHHDVDRVPDGVVQLSCDPGPLVDPGRSSDLGVLALQIGHIERQLFGAGLVAPNADGDEPAASQQQEPHDRGERIGIAGPDERPDRQEGRRPGDQRPGDGHRPGDTDRVGEEGCRQRRVAVTLDGADREVEHGRGSEGRGRSEAPSGQQERRAQREEPARSLDGPVLIDVGVAAQRDHRDPHEQAGQGHVGHQPPGPAVHTAVSVHPAGHTRRRYCAVGVIESPRRRTPDPSVE